MTTNNIKVIKKSGTQMSFDENKIISAVTLSAERALVKFTDDDYKAIITVVKEHLSNMELLEIEVKELHIIVENALDIVNPNVAKAYREYRNYKKDFLGITDRVFRKRQAIEHIGDKENSNTDSALVATKRSLIYGEVNKEFYKKFFLNTEELTAIHDGYIYIHDMVSRLDTINCCLFDVGKVLENGFEMGNIFYSEPKTIGTALDVIGDLVLAVAGQQYGGFTLPEIDTMLEKYVEMTFTKYEEKYKERFNLQELTEDMKKFILEDITYEVENGFQGLEYKFNTVGSSRGDYPFITMSFGLGTSRGAKMITSAILKTRAGGQGKPGNKKPVLFPKLVFLYDEELHGDDKPNEDLFTEALHCSSKAMYPDFLSLTGEGYVPEMYKKYKRVVSPMGCRAFLSPWYEKGGREPEDENDKPLFIGRFNIGAISLNLPMILAKARKEDKDFYEVLDHYLEMIRQLHLKTYEYLGKMKASTNPVAFCEGGFYGGNLGIYDNIAPVLESATASFGVTALNELNHLYNGKSITEDGEFPTEVMEYINNKIQDYKKEDKRLYAVYGTPAESLCGLQVQQFRDKYGIVDNVSSKDYNSNSFHSHVSENLTPIEKQDKEKRFWNLCNGGKIQYVKYPIDYNIEAMKSLVRRAMGYGFYEGINLSLSYCNDCGHQELNMDSCTKCNSYNLTKIDRMNGYLSYSRTNGDTRLNSAKMKEIKDRVSM